MQDENLEACRFWRRSIVLEDGVIGIYPGRNAVVGLNPAAAAIWDGLVASQNRESVAATYALQVPARAGFAASDVGSCLEIWRQQGLLRRPAPKPDRSGLSFGASGQEVFAYQRSLHVGGQTVSVCVEDAGLGAALRELLQDFPEAKGDPGLRLQALGPEGGWRICLDNVFHRPAADLVEARGIVVGEIIRLMAGDEPWKAVLHAAVLSDGHHSVLMTGQSGAGKSTLSAAFVARGWKLVAEDCAAFDAGMHVAPMPFAFSFKTGAWEVLSASYPDLPTAITHRIGQRDMRYQPLPASARAQHPCRPDLIVDIRFRPDFLAERHDAHPLGPLETLKLFFNEESFVDFEADCGDDFLSFATRTPAFSMEYGSSEAAISAVKDLLHLQTAR